MENRPSPSPTAPVSALSHKEFLQQYVLNRASISDNLNGTTAACEAERAWKEIEKVCEK